ncbi:tRNA (adenine(37)-N6)-methyltransferase [Alexandromys fortis]|uniref:tRNA (adenine(37)-N6)-methyltransferase n=1 Tax=Alexandromys fortis TaxID=100897 RepID=UPI0021538F13|nr:tRNA (adenine(37)-N6)-methyltransferase [Microtus fortis]
MCTILGGHTACRKMDRRWAARTASLRQPPALHAETGPPLTAFSKTRHRATTAQAPKPTGRKRKRKAAYGVWTIQRPAAMRGLAERGSCTPAAPCGCTQPALETGNLLTEPIGYLESCFLAKNGTPRQPSICSYSRACLKIRKSIFNNPKHSLMGLEQFSHVWILFVFHKNGHLNYKAKVQPPRLNGAKTGVFSTRSPHRPNAIGLTLAKLEKVEGGAVFLSGIDMIHGTPVLDIKPYIADYDTPQNLEPLEDSNVQHKPRAASQSDGTADSCDQRLLPGCENALHCHSAEEKLKCLEDGTPEDTSQKPRDGTETWHALRGDRERTVGVALESSRSAGVDVAEEQCGPQDLKNFLDKGTDRSRNIDHAVVKGNNAETQWASFHARTADRVPCSVVPAWVKEAPAASLQVRFTPHAEMDLRKLSSGDAGQVSFKYFQSAEEARCAIEALLSADPRSVYRRKLCQDRLFFFTVDTAHVTCWFGQGFAEVLQIKLASEPVEMTDPEESLVALGS